MENASKALLIAAGVLIAVLLTTLGIKVANSSKGAVEQSEEIGGTISSTSQSAIGKLTGLLGIQAKPSTDTLGGKGETAHDDAFIWGSDDPSSPYYGVVIGYTEKAESYTILKFPERCTEISFYFDEEQYKKAGITVDESLGWYNKCGVTRAFTNNIKKIEIPSTVKSIESFAFGNIGGGSFSEVTEIVISEGLKTIGKGTFICCEKLNEITIPNSVTSIEDRAFEGCNNLKKIKLMSTSVWGFESNIFSDIATDSKIYVLSENIREDLKWTYNRDKTTVEVVTEEEMENI